MLQDAQRKYEEIRAEIEERKKKERKLAEDALFDVLLGHVKRSDLNDPKQRREYDRLRRLVEREHPGVDTDTFDKLIEEQKKT